MKVMRKYVDSGELCIGDFESFRIFLFVEFSAHGQARLGRRSGNEFDDCAIAAQGFAAPVDTDERKESMLASRPGDSHPQALLEPYVKLSLHTAPDVQLLTCRPRQWANRLGSARTTRAHHSRTPLG